MERRYSIIRKEGRWRILRQIKFNELEGTKLLIGGSSKNRQDTQKALNNIASNYSAEGYDIKFVGEGKLIIND